MDRATGALAELTARVCACASDCPACSSGPGSLCGHDVAAAQADRLWERRNGSLVQARRRRACADGARRANRRRRRDVRDEREEAARPRGRGVPVDDGGDGGERHPDRRRAAHCRVRREPREGRGDGAAEHDPGAALVSRRRLRCPLPGVGSGAPHDAARAHPRCGPCHDRRAGAVRRRRAGAVSALRRAPRSVERQPVDDLDVRRGRRRHGAAATSPGARSAGGRRAPPVRDVVPVRVRALGRAAGLPAGDRRRGEGRRRRRGRRHGRSRHRDQRQPLSPAVIREAVEEAGYELVSGSA